MKSEIEQHCAEIERCNQRGGRMLSIVDLIKAGTMDRELATYSLAAIGAGASFMVGALPGGAGKTTVMGALLNFVPHDVSLVAADSEAVIEEGLADRTRRRCYICHEIGSGPYYAYLWGEPLRRYFDLPAAGHMIATNLHADTYGEAHERVCGENQVSAAAFHRVNLLYFLAVDGRGRNGRRRIVAVWESEGEREHLQVFGPGMSAPPSRASGIVSADALQAARLILDAIMVSGARSIQEVRTALTEGKT